MEQQLVTIANFAFPTDPRFNVLVARLEQEGIPCAAADDVTIAVDPFLSPALGGVKVKVRAEDAGRAWQIYQDIQRAEAFGEEVVPDSDDLEWEEERQLQSRRGIRIFLLAAVILMLGVLLFLLLRNVLSV